MWEPDLPAQPPDLHPVPAEEEPDRGKELALQVVRKSLQSLFVYVIARDANLFI